MLRASVICLAVIILAMLAAAPAWAADMTVDVNCSLAEAIANANTDRQVHADCPAGSGHDVINFAWDITVGRQLTISSEITIQGGGTISGENRSRIFYVENHGTLTLKNVTLRDGKATGAECHTGSTRTFFQSGGAIFNNGVLQIVDSVFAGNFAPWSGGAIFYCSGNTVLSSVRISGSQFDGNSSGKAGGAIGSHWGRRLTIVGSQFNANETLGYGGAIAAAGDSNIAYSVFSKNIANGGGGGALSIKGEAGITDSDFIGNSSRLGGGAIGNGGILTIAESRFRANSAYEGSGAIYNGNDISISRSEFSDNSGRFGGAFGTHHRNSSAVIRESVFSGNSASDEDGAAIYNRGDMALSGNHFSDNSPKDCAGVTCESVPLSALQPIDTGGPADEPPPAEEPPPAADDAQPPTAAMPRPSLLAVEHVACAAQDIYLILALKSATPDKDRLFEAQISTEGSARIVDIAPLPKSKSLPKRLASVVGLSLVGEGLNAVTGFPLAGTVFKAGAELSKWIDEQFTSSSGPLNFRLTWYNTSVHPGIERWLVHATRAGDGNLRIATRLAPLTEIASFTRDAAEQDTYSTAVKDSIDVALYMMAGGLSMADEAVDGGGSRNLLRGGASWLLDLADTATDLLGRAADTDLANKAIDWMNAPAEWVLDTLVTNPVAYWSERFFTQAGETTAPVSIC